MSEQKINYMQQLDQWSEATVIQPLHQAIIDGDSDECEATAEGVKKAIREKVLESYKNGLKAGAGSVRREMGEVQSRQAGVGRRA